MRLKGKKVVLLVENNYQDLELWVPYYRLKEEGAQVTVVGSGSSRTYTSKYGYPIDAEKEAKEIDISKYDGIVIPGGYAPDMMRRYPEMVKMVREAHQKGKVIAAICHAGWMLVSAGILKGKKVSEIKIGVLGCGSIAEIAHFPSIAKTKRLILQAVCDINEKTAKTADIF